MARGKGRNTAPALGLEVLQELSKAHLHSLTADTTKHQIKQDRPHVTKNVSVRVPLRLRAILSSPAGAVSRVGWAQNCRIATWRANPPGRATEVQPASPDDPRSSDNVREWILCRLLPLLFAFGATSGSVESKARPDAPDPRGLPGVWSKYDRTIFSGELQIM